MVGLISNFFKVVLLTVLITQIQAQENKKYKIHDENRPRPDSVTPSTFSQMATPPSDAIILFDGKDLSEWQSGGKGKKNVKWKIMDNFFEVKKGTGSIRTKKEFGDVQLHIEWATPIKIDGESQGRGNSGVFFMTGGGGYGYEVQVLDSYNNPTYADGQASAIYGQYPPTVNASAKPGEWQTYDIIFIRPRFGELGNLLQPSYLTVFHNGILVHHYRELMGPTSHSVRTNYSAHPDRLPISLQDHGNPVRYKNIWVRDLEAVNIKN